MKKITQIGICLFLVLLTACVIFLPMRISGRQETGRLGKATYRPYKVGSRPQLTSELVARLYYERTIDIDYNFSGMINEGNSTEVIRQDAIELIKNLFGDDPAVCEFVKNILLTGKYEYYRNSSLVKVDQKPIALNFITFRLYKEDTYFELIFEEKTKTPIIGSLNFSRHAFSDAKEELRSLKAMRDMIRDYYETQLHFKEHEYYVTDAQSETVSGSLSSYPDGYNILVFALMQDPNEFLYEKEAQIYNSDAT